MEYLILRWVHLVFGAMWAGGAITMGWFIIPALGGAGPAARPVMEGVLARRFPQVMMISGLLTVLAGLRLYMLRFTVDWVRTPDGILLTLGGLLGLAALIIGTAVQARNASRLGQFMASLGGNPPTPEQQAQIGAMQARMGRTANLLAWVMAGALVLMGGARVFA